MSPRLPIINRSQSVLSQGRHYCDMDNEMYFLKEKVDSNVSD